MKNFILTGLMLFVLHVMAFTQIRQKLREIPFEFVEGYGVFMPGFEQLNEISFEKSESWAMTDVPVNGIPSNWQSIFNH